MGQVGDQTAEPREERKKCAEQFIGVAALCYALIVDCIPTLPDADNPSLPSRMNRCDAKVARNYIFQVDQLQRPNWSTPCLCQQDGDQPDGERKSPLPFRTLGEASKMFGIKCSVSVREQRNFSDYYATQKRGAIILVHRHNNRVYTFYWQRRSGAAIEADQRLSG